MVLVQLAPPPSGDFDIYIYMHIRYVRSFFCWGADCILFGFQMVYIGVASFLERGS